MKYSHQPQRLPFSLERLHFADERPGYHITNSQSLLGVEEVGSFMLGFIVGVATVVRTVSGAGGSVLGRLQ